MNILGGLNLAFHMYSSILVATEMCRADRMSDGTVLKMTPHRYYYYCVFPEIFRPIILNLLMTCVQMKLSSWTERRKGPKSYMALNRA